MKHFVVILENGHWPMTFKTTSPADAYECIANLLRAQNATYPGYREGFLMALAAMKENKLDRYVSPGVGGVRVHLADGEV